MIKTICSNFTMSTITIIIIFRMPNCIKIIIKNKFGWTFSSSGIRGLFTISFYCP